MKTILLAVTALLFTACAHQAPVKIPEGGGIYPFGAYQHAIRVEIQQPVVRTMDMRGAVSVSADKIKVVGLSGSANGLPHRRDVKTGEIKKEFFVEAIEAPPYVRVMDDRDPRRGLVGHLRHVGALHAVLA